jgi:hypothetical protein
MLYKGLILKFIPVFVIKLGSGGETTMVTAVYPSGSCASIVYDIDDPTATVCVVRVKPESKIGILFVTVKVKHYV